MFWSRSSRHLVVGDRQALPPGAVVIRESDAERLAGGLVGAPGFGHVLEPPAAQISIQDAPLRP